MSEQNELITMLEDSARRFLSNLATETTGNGIWNGMAQAGWLGLTLPESHGGAGLGLAEATALTRIFGEAAQSTGFIAHNLLPTAILAATAPDNPAIVKLCQQLMEGSARPTLAWQEKAGQLGEEIPTTTLTEGRLSGTKQFVPGAGAASHLLVTAQQGAELVIVLVESNLPGVTISQDFASADQFGRINFDDIAIDQDSILLRGNEAAAALNRSLNQGRIALAAELEGIASACFNKTMEYIKTRKQFNRVIGSFQGIRHRSVDLLIDLRIAASSWRRGLECTSDRALALQACAAKARCADTALKVAKESVQMHGAMGFTVEAGVGRYFDAAIACSAWLGSSSRLRQMLLSQSNAPTGQKEIKAEIITPKPGMDFNGLDDDVFRLTLRHWLAEHYPKNHCQSHRRPHLRFYGPELRNWLRTLNQHGWRAPDWPREHGGMGLSFRKQLIYKEEFNRARVGRIVDNGETQLGPTIMKFGTPEQKRYFLPRILNSDDHWAQGYSEPNAGSDLASLSTRAELDGDHFVVNGQKIWTTFAQECTYIYALVRTGRFEKKQQGISFLLIDLSLPGITIRPIRNIAGEDELCEVFFDNVKVPVENLLGELHQGWTIAKSLLGHERIWLGDPTMAMRALALSTQLIAENGLDDDPDVKSRYASLFADLHDYRNIYADICDQVEATGEIHPEVSLLKVFASELLQRTSEFNLSLGQEYGLACGDVTVGNTPTNLHWQLMMTRPTTIYAGCNEVQRDILAAGLGLPRG